MSSVYCLEHPELHLGLASPSSTLPESIKPRGFVPLWAEHPISDTLQVETRMYCWVVMKTGRSVHTPVQSTLTHSPGHLILHPGPSMPTWWLDSHPPWWLDSHPPTAKSFKSSQVQTDGCSAVTWSRVLASGHLPPYGGGV